MSTVVHLHLGIGLTPGEGKTKQPRLLPVHRRIDYFTAGLCTHGAENVNCSSRHRRSTIIIKIISRLWDRWTLRPPRY